MQTSIIFDCLNHVILFTGYNSIRVAAFFSIVNINLKKKIFAYQMIVKDLCTHFVPFNIDVHFIVLCHHEIIANKNE